MALLLKICKFSLSESQSTQDLINVFDQDPVEAGISSPKSSSDLWNLQNSKEIVSFRVSVFLSPSAIYEFAVWSFSLFLFQPMNANTVYNVLLCPHCVFSYIPLAQAFFQTVRWRQDSYCLFFLLVHVIVITIVVVVVDNE